jgi:hypothetical protein
MIFDYGFGYEIVFMDVCGLLDCTQWLFVSWIHKKNQNLHCIPDVIFAVIILDFR